MARFSICVALCAVFGLQYFSEAVHLRRADRPKVQFFSEENYQELVWERDLDSMKESECINIPESALELDFKSIKTGGECLVLYNEPHCLKPFGNKKYSIYSKILEENQANFSFSETRKPASFHICNEDQGGNAKVNVDFYNKDGFPYSDAQFKDVCACQNLPESVTAARASSEMDNHGNCVRIYCGAECRGATKEVPAGFNHHSQILRIAGNMDLRGCNRPASFAPCGVTQCSRLHATVYKMDIRNATSAEGSQLEKVEMDTQVLYRNPETESINKEFEIEEELTSFVEFSVGDDVTDSVHSVKLDDAVEVSVEDLVPLATRAEFEGDLKHQYQYEKKRVSGRTTRRIQYHKEIELEQRFEVPACSEVRVRGEVEMVRDFPIEYTAWARISGEEKGEKMTVQEIRAKLGGAGDKMVYLRETDDDMIEVTFEGKMRANYAVGAEMHMEHERVIEGCFVMEDTSAMVEVEDLHLDETTMEEAEAHMDDQAMLEEEAVDFVEEAE